MNKNKQIIVGNIEQEIYNCPYCDGIPIVEVDIEKQEFQSDKVNFHKQITCPWCGLSADMVVWEAICDKIDEAINKDATEERRMRNGRKHG